MKNSKKQGIKGHGGSYERNNEVVFEIYASEEEYIGVCQDELDFERENMGGSCKSLIVKLEHFMNTEGPDIW